MDKKNTLQIKTPEKVFQCTQNADSSCFELVMGEESPLNPLNVKTPEMLKYHVCLKHNNVVLKSSFITAV